MLFDSLLMKSPSSLLKVRWVKERVESRLVYEKWSSLGRVAVREQTAHPDSGRLGVERQRSDGATGRAAVHGHRRRRVHGADPVRRRSAAARIPEIRRDQHGALPEAAIRTCSWSGRAAAGTSSRRWRFHQRSVVGVEINRDIIGAVNRDFGDFTGHLDRDPRVTFVQRRGAQLHRPVEPGRFDIIQVSLDRHLGGDRRPERSSCPRTPSIRPRPGKASSAT